MTLYKTDGMQAFFFFIVNSGDIHTVQALLKFSRERSHLKMESSDYHDFVIKQL